MLEKLSKALLTWQQQAVSPRIFNSKAMRGVSPACGIALFLILAIGEAGTAPMASAQLIANPNAISQSSAKCDAQTRLLLKASEGLLYPSESDYPFTYFSFPSVSKLPTPQGFLQLTGLSGQSVTQIDFERLFDRLARIDPGMDQMQIIAARRYRLLQKTFKSTYKQLTVYRVGEIQIQVYIAGINNCGLTGLQTVSIET